jgi:hypothetical protein
LRRSRHLEKAGGDTECGYNNRSYVQFLSRVA